jgi:two-component system cell cycle sensor histidine kinase/response regulator CckA
LETVGRLAGGVAHDFNNLLTAINGYSELLLDALPREHAFHETVAEIRRAGSRAAVLTRQLLAFSSRMMLAPRPLDLNGLLAGMEPGLRDAAGPSVEVRFEPDPDLDPVHMDPGPLELVIQGVISNARDAMPAGGVLRIQTAMVRIGSDTGPDGEGREMARLKPGLYALLLIEDTGSGMEREVMARVFEPFFTTKMMGKGAGMGLSMAYGILRQSSGAIYLDSTPGKGTRVRIYLPVATHPPVRIAESAASRPA